MHLGDPTLKGYAVLQRSSLRRLRRARRPEERSSRGSRNAKRTSTSHPGRTSPPQIAAFREWEQPTATRFADLKGIQHPSLVVNGIHDEMIPVSNSYRLIENLPNAVLLAYPDSGHELCFSFINRSRDRHPHFSRRTLLSRRTDRQEGWLAYLWSLTQPTRL